MNKERCRKLVERAVENFQLDLSGLTVLTEAASNNFSFTPLIAARAKAERVLVLSKDSKYGKGEDVARDVLALARDWGVDGKVVAIPRHSELVGQADIVTNLGFVRPIDGSFLGRLKEEVVIPLMWETWEFRPKDLDLVECRRKGIPVLGTNEGHPLLRTFDFIGLLAVKLLMEAEIEILFSKILVIGSGAFGATVQKTLLAAGADVLLNKANEKALDCSWPDAIVLVEHVSRELLLGQGAFINIDQLKKINPACVIVHIAGSVDFPALKSSGLSFVPTDIAPSGHMSRTTDHLGPRPVIDLHAAGLKVGELMARSRRTGHKGRQCELAVLKISDLAQDFAAADRTAMGAQ